MHVSVDCKSAGSQKKKKKGKNHVDGPPVANLVGATCIVVCGMERKGREGKQRNRCEATVGGVRSAYASTKSHAPCSFRWVKELILCILIVGNIFFCDVNLFSYKIYLCLFFLC